MKTEELHLENKTIGSNQEIKQNENKQKGENTLDEVNNLSKLFE